jgi:hypothetical protein
MYEKLIELAKEEVRKNESQINHYSEQGSMGKAIVLASITRRDAWLAAIPQTGA